MPYIKSVVVGDVGVGKSSLLITYVTNKFPDFIPAVGCDRFEFQLMVNDEPVSVDLWDSQAHEEYDRLRPLVYPSTHIFLVCFSVVSHASYENVREKWIPEIHHHIPNAPFLLVGTKIDLRNDEQTLETVGNPLDASAGETLAKQLGAKMYVECSALTQDGLKTVFDQAIRSALNQTSGKRKKNCQIL